MARKLSLPFGIRAPRCPDSRSRYSTRTCSSSGGRVSEKPGAKLTGGSYVAAPVVPNARCSVTMATVATRREVLDRELDGIANSCVRIPAIHVIHSEHVGDESQSNTPRSTNCASSVQYSSELYRKGLVVRVEPKAGTIIDAIHIERIEMHLLRHAGAWERPSNYRDACEPHHASVSLVRISRELSGRLPRKSPCEDPPRQAGCRCGGRRNCSTRIASNLYSIVP